MRCGATGFPFHAWALVRAGGAASGTKYTWIDANGRVVYSAQQHSGNVGVQSIARPPPPANPNAVKELASQEAALQLRRQMRAEEEAKGLKTRLASLEKQASELVSESQRQLRMQKEHATSNRVLYIIAR